MTLRFDKRIQKLTSDLEALEHSPLSNDKFLRSRFYPFSNESGIQLPYTTLNDTQPIIVPKGTIRAAILIGQSSFCSLLPVLEKHCDLAVFADMNPYLLTHTRKLLEILQTSKSRKNFEEQYEIKKKDLVFESLKVSQAKPDLKMRKETLGRYHFLDNDTNFFKAQKVAKKMKFAFCRVNFFDKTERTLFFDSFDKSQITFFNVTNLYERDAPTILTKIKAESDWKPGRLEEIFSHLKKHNPIIMHSIRENHVEKCRLTLQISFSYEEYLKKNEEKVKKYFLNKFSKPPLQDNNDANNTPSTFTPQFVGYRAKEKNKGALSSEKAITNQNVINSPKRLKQEFR